MHSFSKTKRKRDLRIFLAVLAGSVLLIVGFVFVLCMEPRITDQNEMPGEPENPEAINGYVSYETPDVCKIGICCEPVLEEGYASIFLTNPADNDVLIRAELYSVRIVYDEKTGQASYLPDELLGKTGFIHPGTYVKQVKVKGIRPGEATKVMVKISTMYEDSGISKGIFYIRTTMP